MAWFAARAREGQRPRRSDIGGKARLKTMGKAQRSKIATRAANARWKKSKR